MKAHVMAQLYFWRGEMGPSNIIACAPMSAGHLGISKGRGQNNVVLEVRTCSLTKTLLLTFNTTYQNTFFGGV